MVKVGPSEPPHPSKPLELFAAKNEFESAQIHLHATGAPGRAVRVRVGDLVDRASGARIVSARDLLLSREDYATIERPSSPQGRTGQIPDVLVPERDAVFGEARNAFPFDVPKGETRSVWLDVFVRPDTPDGLYEGAIEVLEGESVVEKLPLSLRVWAFELPSTSTLQSFFAATPLGMCTQLYGSYEACQKYPGAAGNPDRGAEASHVAMARFLLDHRVTSAEVVYAGSAKEGWKHFDHVYDPLLFGTAETRLRGARLTTFAYVGKADDFSFLRTWYAHAKEKGWDNRLVYYQCDEPPLNCTFGRAKATGDLVHAVSPSFATMVTVDIESGRRHDLLDAVDVFVPNVAQLAPRDEPSRRGDYSAFLKRPKKRLWWYQACDQHGRCNDTDPVLPDVHWPSYMVDDSPMQNRVFQWLAFAYGVSGEIYYQVDHCWAYPCGNGTNDPFVSLRAYGGNGDGTLVYPGKPSRIGGSSPTILSSIRLEHIRDGYEDYEYLWMLQANGERAFADEITKSFIESAWNFSEDPEKLQHARRRIGEHLHERARK